MKDHECDILVIGGGPAGSLAAFAASNNKARVILIDRKPVIGMPIRCAEYIPAPLLGEIDIGWECIVQSVKGMRTILPDGEIQETHAPGFIVRRDILDQALVTRAIDAGVEIRPGCRALSMNDKTVVVKESAGTFNIRARVIIGADGPHSRVGKWINSTNLNLIPAIQARLSLVSPMDCTHVYFDRDYFTGYAWVFPRGNIANVGLGMKTYPATGYTLMENLNRFISRLKKENVVKGEPLNRTAGWIPAERPRKIVQDNIMLAGDAAGQTHPVTGAGIAQAVICGQMAGKWAARALLEGDLGLLKEYENEWYELYGDSQKRACERRELMEREWDNLDAVIKRCWIAFKEYYE